MDDELFGLDDELPPWADEDEHTIPEELDNLDLDGEEVIP